MLCWSQGNRDHFPGDPWIHFCNGCCEVSIIFELSTALLKITSEILQLAMRSFLLTFRISNYETPCTHKPSYNNFQQGQIMQCIVTCAAGMYCSLLILVLRYNVLFIRTYHPDTLWKCTKMWGYLSTFRSQKDPRANKFLEHCLRKWLSRIYSVSVAVEWRANKSQVHYKIYI